MIRIGSKKITCQAVVYLVLFMVVFMAVKISAFPQAEGSRDSIAQTTEPDKGESPAEKRKVNYTATFIIFLLIVAVLAYGYHKEKKRSF
jgi:hypothetical protein